LTRKTIQPAGLGQVLSGFETSKHNEHANSTLPLVDGILNLTDVQ